MANSLILDVETVALDDAGQFIEEPSAPSNWRDPEKIAAYVKEAKAATISKCALDVDLCRVVAIGVDIGWPNVYVDDGAEKDLLRWAWNHIGAASEVIGFNILGFDLPVLIRRSQYLGITIPPMNLDRYRTPHIDLMERLSFNGKLKYRSLDFYCKRFGITVPDEHKGKDIAALVQANEWDAVAAHCRADVEKTRQLAARLGLLTAVGEPEGVF